MPHSAKALRMEEQIIWIAIQSNYVVYGRSIKTPSFENEGVFYFLGG